MFRKAKALAELGYFERAVKLLEELKKKNPSGRLTFRSLPSSPVKPLHRRRSSRWRTVETASDRQRAREGEQQKTQGYASHSLPFLICCIHWPQAFCPETRVRRKPKKGLSPCSRPELRKLRMMNRLLHPLRLLDSGSCFDASLFRSSTIQRIV
jgi:hypothetical protein